MILGRYLRVDALHLSGWTLSVLFVGLEPKGKRGAEASASVMP